MRRVGYVPQAEADLLDIWDYIAADSKVYATKFVSRIRQKIRLLATLTQPGRVHEDVSRPGVRGYTERAYLILFELTDDRLTVLRIVHGSRDVRQIVV